MTRTCLVGDVRAASAFMNSRAKSASGGGGMYPPSVCDSRTRFSTVGKRLWVE
jgi:hypothetical protein